MQMDIYNLITAEWFNVTGIGRFRHVSWIYGDCVYTHGGFENNKPNIPTSALT